MSYNIVNQDGSLTPVAGSINASVVETTYADYKAMEENETLRQDVAYYIKDEQVTGNIPVFTNIDESLENVASSDFTITYDKNRNVVLNGTGSSTISAPMKSYSRANEYPWNKQTAHIGDVYTIKFQHISGTASITPKLYIDVWNGYVGQSASPITYATFSANPTKDEEIFTFTVTEELGFKEGVIFVIQPEIICNSSITFTDYTFRWWIEKCEPQNMSPFCSPMQANTEISKKTYITDVKTISGSSSTVSVTLPNKKSSGILVVNAVYQGTMYALLYSVREGSYIYPVSGDYIVTSSGNLAKSDMVTSISVSSGTVSITFQTSGYVFFIGM